MVLHYFAKWETQKLRIFTTTLYVVLPTNTQNTFKLSPGRCWITFIPKVIECMHQTIKTYPERQHSILLSVTGTLYVYQVCHGFSRCVKNGSCSSSSLEWKEMHSINGISCYFNKCHTLSNTSQATFFFLSGRQRNGAHALCVQHSPTAAALLNAFLLNHDPQQPWAECIYYKIYGVLQQREYESWVKKTEEIKQRLVEFWQCTDLSEKCDFRVSPFCQVVQNTRYLRWYSKVSFDCLLYE